MSLAARHSCEGRTLPADSQNDLTPCGEKDGAKVKLRLPAID